jgi:fructose-specific component phosphotransferase system IIB-like protein
MNMFLNNLFSIKTNKNNEDFEKLVSIVKDEADGVIVYGNSIYNNVNL